MSGLFTLSYSLLSGLVALEAVLLREALRRTARLKRFSDGFVHKKSREKRLPGDSLMPKFSAPLMSTGRTIASSDMAVGKETMLLFVSPADAASSPAHYRHLTTAAHVMWHQMEGHIYIVCTGNEESCRKFARDFQIAEDIVILDEDGEVARTFMIEETPRGLRFDEDLRLFRYGFPVMIEDPAPEEAETGCHKHTHPAAGASREDAVLQNSDGTSTYVEVGEGKHEQ